MIGDYAILQGRDVVPCGLMTWANWHSDFSARIVATTQIGESEVSTVFLGSDHSFGTGPSLWFETLIFGGPMADEMWRYSTYDEAEAGHAAAVESVKNAMPFAALTPQERP